MPVVPDPLPLPDAERPRLPLDVGSVLVRDCLDALGADAGFVATVAPDGATLEVFRVTPYSEKPARFAFPASAPIPLAEVVRTRRPLVIGSNDELCHHPGLVRVEADDHACATMPLVAEDGEFLGALNLGYEDPRSFSGDELELVRTLARRCSEAMAAALALERDVSQRESRAA